MAVSRVKPTFPCLMFLILVIFALASVVLAIWPSLSLASPPAIICRFLFARRTARASLTICKNRVKY